MNEKKEDRKKVLILLKRVNVRTCKSTASLAVIAKSTDRQTKVQIRKVYQKLKYKATAA